MPIYEVEHTVWIGIREHTLVRASNRDEATNKFETKYDGRNIDLRFSHPESINVQIDQVVKYPFKINEDSEDVDILE